MKKSSIEKRLKKDLQAATPFDFDGVQNRCLHAQYDDTEEVAFDTLARKRTGVWFRVVATFLALVTVVGVCFWFWKREEKKTNQNFDLSITSGSFILDVNPSVEICYDENGLVTQTFGLNDDGEVLLYGVDLLGQTYQTAAQTLFLQCVELGYFSAQRTDNAMLVSAVREDGARDEEMTMVCKNLFSQAFVESNICGVVITGVQDATLNAKAQEYGIDGQKYALILDYLDLGGEMDTQAYQTISIRELYALIAEKTQEKENARIAELEVQKRQAKETLLSKVSQSVEETVAFLQEILNRQEGGGGYGDMGFPSSQKEYYQRYINGIQTLCDDINSAQNKQEFDESLEQLLTAFEQIKADEHTIGLTSALTKIKEEIRTLRVEIANTHTEYKELTATTQERYQARRDKFSEEKNDETKNVQEWQEQNEQDFSSSWYDKKNQWISERKEDVKKY